MTRRTLWAVQVVRRHLAAASWTAAEGDRPAGGVGTLYTAIVTIDSVDTAKGTVSFTGPEGKQRKTTVQRDAGRDFIAQLKPGDRVQLTYGESLAIAVAPADEERALR